MFWLMLIIYFAAKEAKEKEKEKGQPPQLAVPRLSVCADAQKVDRAKMAQVEVSQNNLSMGF